LTAVFLGLRIFPGLVQEGVMELVLHIKERANLFKKCGTGDQLQIVRQASLEPGDIVRASSLELLRFERSSFSAFRIRLDGEVFYVLACEVGQAPTSWAHVN
jgi:hypothetical protein